MIKSRDPNDKASVIFTLPAVVGARKAAICGEWNDWSPDADVMDVVDDGFSLTVELDVGRTYRFRYLLDGERWENDWDADFYAPNAFGGDDSVVDLRDLPASEPTRPTETRPVAESPTRSPERYATAVVRICMPPSETG